MNKLLKLSLALVATAALFFASHPFQQKATADSTYALDSDLKTIDSLTGGTNNVAVSATNTYAAFDVSGIDAFGFKLSFKGNGAGTSTVQILGYQGIDSDEYETTPSLSRLVTLNGTTLVCTNIDVSVPGGGSYKLVIGNTNGSVAITNITGKVRLKKVTVKVR
jgi:hypothetical protein